MFMVNKVCWMAQSLDKNRNENTVESSWKKYRISTCIGFGTHFLGLVTRVATMVKNLFSSKKEIPFDNEAIVVCIRTCLKIAQQFGVGEFQETLDDQTKKEIVFIDRFKNDLIKYKNPALYPQARLSIIDQEEVMKDCISQFDTLFKQKKVPYFKKLYWQLKGFTNGNCKENKIERVHLYVKGEIQLQMQETTQVSSLPMDVAKAWLLANSCISKLWRMEQLSEESSAGFRSSKSKTDDEMQFLPINARVQSIQLNDYKFSQITSGAIAVHGRKVKGWKKHEGIFDLADTQDVNLQQELEIRKKMVTSQALGLLAMALSEALQNEKIKNQIIETKQFLWNATGLLTAQGKERAMIQDMRWALNHIGENGVITFHNDSDLQVVVQDESDTIELRMPTSFENLPSQVKVVPTFFNIGVNFNSSFSNRNLEKEITIESFEKLKNYFQSHIQNPSEEIKNRFQSLQNRVEHQNFDIDFLFELTDFIECLGGINLTNCKSGKDRTAMKVTHDEMRQMTQNHPFSSSDRENILDLLRTNGTRIEVCQQSTGFWSYAFNLIQVASLPACLRPQKLFSFLFSSPT